MCQQQDWLSKTAMNPKFRAGTYHQTGFNNSTDNSTCSEAGNGHVVCTYDIYIVLRSNFDMYYPEIEVAK